MKKNYRYLIPVVLLIFIMFLSVLMIRIQRKPDKTNHQTYDSAINPETEMNVETTVFQAQDGWGYDIFIDGKRYIHQPVIPGIAGVTGFHTEDQARKVADLVVTKIKKNMMPPSVSINELDSLGVLK